MLDKGNRKWRELVTGKLAVPTQNLGLQMFLKQTSTRLGGQPSPADVDKAVTEIYGFFVKYERILQKELAVISK